MPAKLNEIYRASFVVFSYSILVLNITSLWMNVQSKNNWWWHVSNVLPFDLIFNTYKNICTYAGNRFNNMLEWPDMLCIHEFLLGPDVQYTITVSFISFIRDRLVCETTLTTNDRNTIHDTHVSCKPLKNFVQQPYL